MLLRVPFASFFKERQNGKHSTLDRLQAGPVTLLACISMVTGKAIADIFKVAVEKFGLRGTACLRHRATLTEMLAGADMVVLLAGRGGGTSSGVTKYMALAARAAGVVTVAAVVTPFEFEGDARNRRANAVVDRLQRDADLVMAFSNEEWINRFSGDESFLDIWDALDRHIATSLYSVVYRLCIPTSLAGSTFSPDCLSV